MLVARLHHHQRNARQSLTVKHRIQPPFLQAFLRSLVVKRFPTDHHRGGRFLCSTRNLTPPRRSIPPLGSTTMLRITDLGVAMRQAMPRITGRAKSDNMQRKPRVGTTEARFLPWAVTAAMLAVAMLRLTTVAASTGPSAAWPTANTTLKERVYSRQARQNETACEVADFVTTMAQMPAGCADMILAAASTGVMPRPEEMCGCMVPIDVDDMPGCAFGAVIFDAETHGSCVAMVAAGTAPPTPAPTTPAVTIVLPACTTVAFLPILAQMTQLCVSTLVFAHGTGVLPSDAVLCGCMVDLDPTLLPACQWLGYNLDAAGHQECVERLADTGGTFECSPAG